MYTSYTEIRRGSTFPCAPPEHQQPQGCSPTSFPARAVLKLGFFFCLCSLLWDNHNRWCWQRAGTGREGPVASAPATSSMLGHRCQLLNPGGISGR